MKNENKVNNIEQKIDSFTRVSKNSINSMVQKPINKVISTARKAGRNMDIARSSNVSRFTPRPTLVNENSPKTVTRSTDNMPKRHPLVAKLDAQHLNKQRQNPVMPVQKPASVIKQEEIAKVFDKLEEHKKSEEIARKKIFKKVNVFSIIIGVIFLTIIGYFIYVNIPILSVKVASAQAGIDATFPEYRPDGYSLNGPVSYSDGQVTIAFKSNTNDSKFVINQSRSSWDSTAVKNQVSKDSNGEFLTTTERGLTIYTYGGNASWVNGGILYTITGDTSLSGDQIRRIATSL